MKTDKLKRTYGRELAEDEMFCSYHDRPHPLEAFAESVRARRRRGHTSAWCTAADTAAQRERRAKKGR